MFGISCLLRSTMITSSRHRLHDNRCDSTAATSSSDSVCSTYAAITVSEGHADGNTSTSSYWDRRKAQNCIFLFHYTSASAQHLPNELVSDLGFTQPPFFHMSLRARSGESVLSGRSATLRAEDCPPCPTNILQLRRGSDYGARLMSTR